MSTKEIIKYLKTTISEKGEYCYSLSKQTTKAIIKHIDKQEEEIERLNNIINELEKWLDEETKLSNETDTLEHISYIEVLDKLQELKGSDKE